MKKFLVFMALLVLLSLVLALTMCRSWPRHFNEPTIEGRYAFRTLYFGGTRFGGVEGSVVYAAEREWLIDNPEHLVRSSPPTFTSNPIDPSDVRVVTSFEDLDTRL